jgi:hypothetical protein
MTKYCTTDAQATAEIEEFIATSAGMSLLGKWGAQCVLLPQHYAKILLGKSPYDTLGYGHANALLAGASNDYFDKTFNDPSKPDLLPRRGDIIVWRGKPLWDGGVYGHIAVVTSVGKTTVTVQQLDGAAAPTRVYPDGYAYSVKPVHTATFAYVGSATVGDVLGWMRPKWQKVVYTGADKRGYGTAPAKKAPAKKAAASTAQSSAYTLDHNPSSNYYTPTESLTVYKQPRKVLGVTIHWWNDPKNAGTHDGTAAYLARKGGDTSAHYVVSPGRVTRLVDDKNAAWHAGNATGNATTIGIECNPHDVEGTLPTVAALIRDLEKKHGDLKVYRHRDWRSTTCPGAYSNQIDKLVNLVNSAPSSKATSAKTETLEEYIMNNEAKIRQIIREEISGTINHLTAGVDDRGKKVMARTAVAAGNGVRDIVIPAKGDAKGKMTLGEHLAWSRDHRAKEIANRAEVDEKLASLAKGINAALDLLDEHKAEHDKTEEN